MRVGSGADARWSAGLKPAPRIVATLGLALAAGAAASLLKLWFFCRRPESEACVWGKAYLPLSLPFEAVALGCLFLIVIAAVRVLVRRS